jgi:hypothetical protein
MNKLEAAYAAYLYGLKTAGEILDFKFESMRLVLADRCSYTPDFLVYMLDDSGEAMEVQIHEVKGHWRDDARVKIRVAARSFPYFRFIGVTRDRTGTWVYEEFLP